MRALAGHSTAIFDFLTRREAAAAAAAAAESGLGALSRVFRTAFQFSNMKYWVLNNWRELQTENR